MFDLTLTFDNGPEPETTPGVLDELARRGIHTTFFVMGRKLAAPGARALAERAKAEGHWIGNHTWSHGTPLGLRAEPDVAETEIERTQALLGPLAHPDRLFRPHGGGDLGPQLLSPAVLRHLEAGGYTMVLWTAVPGDYRDPDGWVERALDQCAAGPWTLMVLHDLPNGAMRRLPAFLDAVEARGGRIRQDFPPGCTPLVRGRATGPLAPYVTETAAP
jgi:peptidoglycan/xylan/chitin deacetylase (PgdA/CDA1 family)